MATFILLRTVLYVTLFSCGLWMNRKEWRLLALTTVVGISIFTPLPQVHRALDWYAQCLVGEIMVAALAITIRCRASVYIVALCGGLSMLHITGMLVGPTPGFGPYRIGVPLLECAELLVCMAAAKPAMFTFHMLLTDSLGDGK
jgi:hypothetical protein